MSAPRTMIAVDTITERCDRCGARGASRWILKNGTLILCGHHTKEHEERLAEITTQDEVRSST